METKFSRRDLLKMAGMSAGVWMIHPYLHTPKPTSLFPDAERLGRICYPEVNLRTRPSVDAPSLGVQPEDKVVAWLREVIGDPVYGRYSRRWVETPDGYLYAPSVQPVRNLPNTPVSSLPPSDKEPGMWAEVTVPYVDLSLANPPGRSPWLDGTTRPRLYYSQIMWINGIQTNEAGQVQYRVDERYGSLGDIFWAEASAFRPITDEDVAPIHPQAENKRVEVNLDYQTLSCFENDTEVYFCQISSGQKYDAEGKVVDKWSTPLGPHPIWRKLISIHMLGGSLGTGYDLPGIGWTSLFSGEGVAIHSTFWHNDFGVAKSHGCVNASPDDAKWIWRWTVPEVTYNPGDVTVQMPGGTIINVIGS
jgi:hypothetical protein